MNKAEKRLLVQYLNMVRNTDGSSSAVNYLMTMYRNKSFVDIINAVDAITTELAADVLDTKATFPTYRSFLK